MLKGRKIHFVGAGGIGMSALALLARESGAVVTGCDLVAGKAVELLRRNGIPVEIGHSPEHISDADIVVYTNAVPKNHPELVAARDMGKELLSREHMLSTVMEQKRGVGITGAHGKTTTTWLVSRILIQAGFDPTVLVGGLVDEISGNFRTGSGEVFVTEVDESNGIAATFKPFAAVVTNVDDEHLDHFTDRRDMAAAIRRFCERAKKDGVIVFSADDPILKEMAGPLRKARPDLNVFTVGFAKDADAPLVEKGKGKGILTVPGVGKLNLEIKLPGSHNLHNAALAAVATLKLGVSPSVVISALAGAQGVHRRQELVSETAGVSIYEDYGHHPTEMIATYHSLKDRVKGRFIVVFQPHRYTRTKALWDRFIEALSLFDYVILMDIYAASESPIEGITSAALAGDAIKKGLKVQYISRAYLVVEHLASIVKPGDTVLALGAGSVGEIAHALAKRLEDPGQD
jgi:UDP-N-acetylmuramate--alanine ligase